MRLTEGSLYKGSKWGFWKGLMYEGSLLRTSPVSESFRGIKRWEDAGWHPILELRNSRPCVPPVPRTPPCAGCHWGPDARGGSWCLEGPQGLLPGMFGTQELRAATIWMILLNHVFHTQSTNFQKMRRIHKHKDTYIGIHKLCRKFPYTHQSNSSMERQYIIKDCFKRHPQPMHVSLIPYTFYACRGCRV